MTEEETQAEEQLECVFAGPGLIGLAELGILVAVILTLLAVLWRLT